MKHLLIIFSLLMSSYLNAESFTSTCISESGRSQYDLELDTYSRDGTIRYRFAEQDVFYKVHIDKVDSELIEGIAIFESSSSGESKGNPFKFTFDLKNNIFNELNITAYCK